MNEKHELIYFVVFFLEYQEERERKEKEEEERKRLARYILNFTQDNNHPI